MDQPQRVKWYDNRVRYFRFYSDEPRNDGSATWGAMTTLFEVDDNFAVQRQLNLFDRAFFTDVFDLSWPDNVAEIMKTKESHGRIRTERLDEAGSRSHEISRNEFEFAWSTGALRERTFGEFKRELLSDSTTDTFGLYEAWWTANKMYPHRPLSDRLAMAERAVRELVAEGLIQLVADGQHPRETVMPREEHDELLRRWDTWVVGDDGPKGFFWATELGRSVNETAWRTLP